MATTKRTGTEVAAAVLAVVAISAGCIPLLRLLVGAGTGRIFSWLPAEAGSGVRYALPIVVIIACLVGIGLLERRNHQNEENNDASRRHGGEMSK